jgi:cytidine deaminase
MEERMDLSLTITDEDRNNIIEMTMEMGNAKILSQPFVSGYRVGAVIRSEGGKNYIGANVEVSPLYNLHAEQSATHNAYVNGEINITHIMVSSLPCGSCRQFLYNINPDMVVYVEDSKYLLKDLIPEAFSKEDLLITEKLQPKKSVVGDRLIGMGKAMTACNISYSPLLQDKGGVVIETVNGREFVGTFIEDPALSPSVMPIMGALSQMFLNSFEIEDINKVYIYTENYKSVNYDSTIDVLKRIGVNRDVVETCWDSQYG